MSSTKRKKERKKRIPAMMYFGLVDNAYIAAKHVRVRSTSTFFKTFKKKGINKLPILPLYQDLL